MIVQSFEFTDYHKELELIQNMFGRIMDQKYMREGQEQEDNQKYGSDYHHNYIGYQVFMSCIHMTLLTLSTLKLFYFFKIFDTFGRLLKTVYHCADDLMVSMGFFVLWIFVNSLLFQALGMEYLTSALAINGSDDTLRTRLAELRAESILVNPTLVNVKNALGMHALFHEVMEQNGDATPLAIRIAYGKNTHGTGTLG